LFVRTPRRSLPQVVVLAVAKALVVTLAMFVGYVAIAVHNDFTDIAEGRRTPPATGDVDPARVLIGQHDCSTTGFGDLPGTLLAVCLDPVD
jgi:hypothetical protein